MLQKAKVSASQPVSKKLVGRGDKVFILVSNCLFNFSPDSSQLNYSASVLTITTAIWRMNYLERNQARARANLKESGQVNKQRDVNMNMVVQVVHLEKRKESVRTEIMKHFATTFFAKLNHYYLISSPLHFQVTCFGLIYD